MSKLQVKKLYLYTDLEYINEWITVIFLIILLFKWSSDIRNIFPTTEMSFFDSEVVLTNTLEIPTSSHELKNSQLYNVFVYNKRFD